MANELDEISFALYLLVKAILQVCTNSMLMMAISVSCLIKPTLRNIHIMDPLITRLNQKKVTFIQIYHDVNDSQHSTEITDKSQVNHITVEL